MNIIYITTAQDQNAYKNFVALWSKKPNPSNQNFHNKMIRCLSKTNRVDVISIRPFSRTMVKTNKLISTENVTTNIHWHYIAIKRNLFFRFTNVLNESLKICKNLPSDAIIVCDSINPLCVAAADKIRKKLKLKTVTFCTDSPSNITGTKKSYTMYLLNKAKKFDGYISLTTELGELYGENNPNHLVIEGIVEPLKNHPGQISLTRPYFFFGGALLPRYGIYELIDAFNEFSAFNKDVDLVICGHHADEQTIEKCIKNNANIKYFGTLDVADIISLEQNSLACINPRPFNADLDRYSIPSKTIEYFNSGRITISGRSSKLQKNFFNEAIWLKESTKDEIRNALNKVVSMDEKERNEIALSAQNKAQKLYSFDVINKKILDFLSTIR